MRRERLQRDPRLQRRLAPARGVQVHPGSQHQLLGHQRRLAGAQQRREALVGRLHRPLHPPRARPRQLQRLAEAAVGDLLALAVAHPGDQRPVYGDFGQVGIRGRQTTGKEGTVQQTDPSSELRIDQLLVGP
jgi:hypothetical protein